MDITHDPTPAQIRHHCLSRFFNVYTAWGYNFVHIPLIDSAHNYERFQGWDLLPHANYSVVDSSGEKAIMRPDMTLFLMHHLPSKKNDTSPQRLWYTDSIVQRSKFKDASPEDILQSGAELIGVPPSTVDFDSEIILLCNHAMEAVGVTHRTTHIGSRELFDHYFQPLLKRSPNHYYALHHTIYERDHVRLPSLIEEVTTVLGYTTKECRQLTALFSYIGAPQKIPNIHIGTPAVQGAARRTLNTLHQTIARLVECVEGSYTVGSLRNRQPQLSHRGLFPSLYSRRKPRRRRWRTLRRRREGACATFGGGLYYHARYR